MIAAGAIWTGMVFASALKESEDFKMESGSMYTMSLPLKGTGIGFYQITSSQYDNSILVRVLDSNGNLASMRTITNKETVNYFTYDHTGQYTLELTNLSPSPMQIAVGFGDTKYQDFGISSSMVLLGSCMLVFVGYTRLRSYITAQPE